ncbi:hypothetical protein HYZ98_00595 [Candidatus Peregrinibacteria bacterium]|nr:hypothetical protein [Candidatus Peregrinibacteria bacterium]
MKTNFLAHFPRRTVSILTLGMLCVVGSFAVGIRTAGDVRTISPLSAETLELPGDIDDNGKIDYVDVIRILEIAQGYREPTPRELHADPNGDGVLTVDDAIALLHELRL